MFIYDDLINEVYKLINNYQKEDLNILNKDFKEDKNQFIFKNDVAFELGGSSKHGFSFDLITLNDIEDSITLIGNNIDKITKDTNYARITIVSSDKELLESNNLYENISSVSYSKYKFALEGVILRESSINSKESLLFSKNKISFEEIGSYFINLYKKNKYVKNVKMIFINLDSFDYLKLKELKEKEVKITKALDHLVNKIDMDCYKCKLKPICDDVSKMIDKNN